jgi:hypothetical protein
VKTPIEMQINIFRSKHDRDLILLEAKNDPEFERQLSEVLQLPDGEERVAISARKAFLNELSPDLYPEMAGSWPILRSVVSKAMESVKSSNSKKTITIDPKPSGLGELGQFEILGPLISAVAGAGASIYSAHVQSVTQKQIANEQLQANMQEIQAQEAMAAAQKAIANAQMTQSVQAVLPAALATPVAGVINTMKTEIGGGVQLWEALLLGYFLFQDLK